jgi:alcohol dehydrogenase (cytochrome c)
MNRRLKLSSIVLFALGAGAVSGALTSSRADMAGIEVDVGDLRGEILSLFAPLGAIATETNPNYKGAASPAPAAPPSTAAADWPSYNKTLTSERFSDLSQINTKNVPKLKVLCTYDTWRLTAMETGLIMVEGALIGTTEFDIFSIDPATCAENWRTHEEYPAYILPTNRGAAYFDGMLFPWDPGRARAGL